MPPLPSPHNLNSSATWDAMHPLSAGTTVAIFRLPVGALPFIEGRAVIAAHDAGRSYWVRFVGESELRSRVVCLEFQHDPEGIRSALSDLWRAEQTLGASVSDFFPPTNPND